MNPPGTSATNPPGTSATTNPAIFLVGCDPLLFEKIRASLAGSPFRFLASADPPAGDEADVLVLPARDLDRLPEASRPPAGSAAVIAYGPAGLMRAGFLAGCVDYLRDPWTPEELALRAEAALARREVSYEFSWGRLRFEGDTVRAPRGQAPLTRQQAVILRALLRRRGRPVPRAALACLLGAGNGRGVDVQVSAIRRRVRAAAPEAGRFIVCVRRQGYMIP